MSQQNRRMSKEKKYKGEQVKASNLAIIRSGIIIIGLIFIVLGSRYLYTVVSKKAVIDSPKTEMKQIPESVKKKITPVPPNESLRVPILLYHYVEYVQDKRDTIRQSLNINPDIFANQVKTLQDAGYTFMTAKELGEVLDGEINLPPKPIILTFDDGHWDFYTNVLPILKKYHVVATAYIVPGFTGGSDSMNQQELQAVVKSGLVDIGAHTVHHISLKNKMLKTVQYEVDKSKVMLEQTYHIHVVSFAYPNGSFDDQAIQVVKNDGFTTAVSTIPGIEQNQVNRYFLYRLRPGGRTGQNLLTWLQQVTFTPYINR